MFVDIAKIHVKSGKGGDGKVSFRREKYVPDGGPDGGDGGKGASVIIKADTSLRTLMDFRYKRKYNADDGESGGKKNCTGKDAEDLIIRVPVGTIIKDEATGKVMADLSENGAIFAVCKGGKGGRGNTHFKNSVRQAPTFSEQGRPAEERTIVLELKMLADVGLLGYPNVGKSTILSVVTKARPKIANYHFTTLQPNLGVVEQVKGKSFVLSDIPGLIEGASEGIGLGHDFLRHVDRCKLLIHVVDVSGVEGRDPLVDFNTINNELKVYSEKLSRRVQVVAANKLDMLYDREQYDAFEKAVKAMGYEVFPISAITGEGLDKLMMRVTELLDTIEVEPLYDENDLYVETIDESKRAVNYYMDGDVFCVDGVPIERLVFSTDFNDIESVRRFQDVLKRSGVVQKLRDMGATDGDTVRVCEIEFDFYE
jgi:GTPase